MNSIWEDDDEDDGLWGTEDYIRFNEDGDLEKNPEIEYLTKSDFIHFFNDMLKRKPEQFPVGDYLIKSCNGICDFSGVLWKDQHFCPNCKSPLYSTGEDPNFGFNELLQKWQTEKNILHNIIIGNLIDLKVDELNGDMTLANNALKDGLEESMIGDEVPVDEF